MSEAEDRLAEDRSNRTTARGLFDTRLAQVKADLAARPVPARIRAKAEDEAAKAIDKGIDIARESKTVVAATLGTLAIWAFRKPLMAMVRNRFGQGEVHDAADRAETNHEEEQQT